MNKRKQKFFMMCGCPGSGKSTFARECLEDYHTIYVSRDDIRFSFVREDEEYFSKENQVYNAFINEIKTNLRKGFNVIADATHLNKKSRSKLLFALANNLENIEVIAVVLDTPFEICISRNENRINTRRYVPYKEIVQMYNNFRMPTFTECNGMIDTIYLVTPDGNIIITNREE